MPSDSSSSKQEEPGQEVAMPSSRDRVRSTECSGRVHFMYGGRGIITIYILVYIFLYLKVPVVFTRHARGDYH